MNRQYIFTTDLKLRQAESSSMVWGFSTRLWYIHCQNTGDICHYGTPKRALMLIFWYPKIISWFQILIFCYNKYSLTLISENHFLIYQKICEFLTRNWFSHIRNWFLTSEFLLQKKFWKLITDTRKSFSDITGHDFYIRNSCIICYRKFDFLIYQKIDFLIYQIIEFLIYQKIDFLTAENQVIFGVPYATNLYLAVTDLFQCLCRVDTMVNSGRGCRSDDVFLEQKYTVIPLI